MLFNIKNVVSSLLKGLNEAKGFFEVKYIYAYIYKQNDKHLNVKLNLYFLYEIHIFLQTEFLYVLLKFKLNFIKIRGVMACLLESFD